jgi:hypothetical protein
MGTKCILTGLTITKHVGCEIEKKRIVRAIDQGFTCLAGQTVQSPSLEVLVNCPTSTHLINDNWKHKP